MIVQAKLKSIELDGIEIMDVPLGKEYIIDLNSKILIFWFNTEHNHSRLIEVVLDAINGGYLPLELLEIELK